MDAPVIPASLHALMARIGPRWREDIQGHVRQMIDAFSDVLEAAPTDGVTLTRDLPYGDHPRQRIDVYRPDAANSAPVVLFVHGGAFVEGDRNRSPQVYANVLRYFARHGLLGLNMGYRLAPEFRYPSGSEDVAAAVAWARTHARQYGGDPDAIVLIAHSAGAAHAGCYAYDRRFHPAGGPGIRALVVLSGRVRADLRPDNPNANRVRAYYGDDPAVLEQGSAVNHVGPDSVPTMVAFGEYENPLIDVYCAELVHRLAVARGTAPPVMRLDGHNHTSVIAHFNTAEDALGSMILRFVQRCLQPPAP
jgi:acetyl esterase/lipase